MQNRTLHEARVMLLHCMSYASGDGAPLPLREKIRGMCDLIEEAGPEEHRVLRALRFYLEHDLNTMTPSQGHEVKLQFMKFGLRALRSKVVSRV